MQKAGKKFAKVCNLESFLPYPKICLQMLKLSLSKTKSQVFFSAKPSLTFISNIN